MYIHTYIILGDFNISGANFLSGKYINRTVNGDASVRAVGSYFYEGLKTVLTSLIRQLRHSISAMLSAKAASKLTLMISPSFEDEIRFNFHD